MAILCELRDVKRNVKVDEVRATNLKEAKQHWEYYLSEKLCNCKVFIVGRCVGNRIIRFTDLVMTDSKELLNITDIILNAVISQNFSNDNQTFFMLERGLVNEDRETLSAKGMELLKAWEK